MLRHVSLQRCDARLRRGALAKEVHALGPISLGWKKGELFAVVPLIVGLGPDSPGTTKFECRAITGVVPDGVGVVFQEDASFPWLTVTDNITAGLREAGVYAGEVYARYSAPWISWGRPILRKLVQRSSPTACANASESPARSCCSRLILLDEPFSALDQRLRRAIRAPPCSSGQITEIVEGK